MSAGIAKVHTGDAIHHHAVSDTAAVSVIDNGALIVPRESGNGTIYAPGSWLRVHIDADE